MIKYTVYHRFVILWHQICSAQLINPHTRTFSTYAFLHPHSILVFIGLLRLHNSWSVTLFSIVNSELSSIARLSTHWAFLESELSTHIFDGLEVTLFRLWDWTRCSRKVLCIIIFLFIFQICTDIKLNLNKYSLNKTFKLHLKRHQSSELSLPASLLDLAILRRLMSPSSSFQRPFRILLR